MPLATCGGCGYTQDTRHLWPVCCKRRSINPALPGAKPTEPGQQVQAAAPDPLRKAAGVMNKTEARYAAYLDTLIKAGEYVDYKYEAVKFKLLDAPAEGPQKTMWYVADFFTTSKSGTNEVHEVKPRDKKTGRYYSREKGVMKIRMAAKEHGSAALKFVVVWPGKVPGTWEREVVG
jgi:hypothetical protein